MPFPLDYLVFVVVFVLTLTLLLTNYVLYFRRGRRHYALSALGTFVAGGLLIGLSLGFAMLSLGEQYGTAEILSRWGFPFGWAFLLALAASCASLYERTPQGKLAVTLNVVATLMLGFALVSGLLIAGELLSPLPASILNLGLAAVFTAILKLMFEKRRPERRTFFQRLFNLKPPKPKSFSKRLGELFRGR